MASAVSTTAEDAWGAMTSCMSRYPLRNVPRRTGRGVLVGPRL
jgi:hypothetical protein